MKTKLQPDALAVADVAALLSAAIAGSGKAITAEMIARDLSDGAPANADGTVNLVHYAAWLVAQMKRT